MSSNIFLHTHNPLNIKFSGVNKWQGQIGEYKGFAKFSSVNYGLRAGIKLLYRYIFEKELCTVEDIVRRFSPDGNEHNYISFLNRYVHKSVTTLDGFVKLVSCMCIFETHYAPSEESIRCIIGMLKLNFDDND